MLKTDIGINAGVIWRCLSERGKLTIREIIELTRFNESMIVLALGWLARENKITFTDVNGSMYINLSIPPSETYY